MHVFGRPNIRSAKEGTPSDFPFCPFPAGENLVSFRRVRFSYTRNMSIFDLIVLAILAALVLRGIWKGMISQIVSVASYIVCWNVAT